MYTVTILYTKTLNLLSNEEHCVGIVTIPQCVMHTKGRQMYVCGIMEYMYVFLF